MADKPDPIPVANVEHDDDEQRVREWLRIIGAVVILFLLIILALVDVLGRLFINPGFHVDPFMFGSLLGGVLLLLGVEGASRLPWGPK